MTHSSFLCKFMRILLTALAINHAWGIGLVSTTWPMKHAGCDCMPESRGGMLIRELSTAKPINILRCPGFALRIKKDQEVHVRKTTLLKLNLVDTTCGLSKAM